VGVIAAAIIIRFTGWSWVDSLVAAGIGLWVLPRTWTLLKESINILLQGVPKGMDLEIIEAALCEIAGVMAIHDLHVWSLTSGKNVLSVHVVADLSMRTDQEILAEVDGVVRRFEITHTTIQVEADGFHAQRHGSLDHDPGHVHTHDH
jgi:cobalt-zinc-cadmium efflux system protein